MLTIGCAARLLTGVLVLVGLILLGPAGYAESDTTLRAVGGAATYEAGRPVTVRLTLRNTGQAACLAPSRPELALSVVGVRRGDTSLYPSVTPVAFEDGASATVAGGLRRLAPGQSLELSLTSESGSAGQVLRTATWTPGGSTLLSSWPVHEPGDYRLTVLAGVPTDTGLPEGVCQGLSGPETVRFVVRPRGYPGWLVIVLAGCGGGALLLAVVWLARHRRRRAVGVYLVIVVAGAGLAVTATPPAEATISPIPSKAGALQGAFQAAYDGCMATFRAPHGDPAGIITGPKGLINGSARVTITPINGVGSSVFSSANSVGGGNTDIYWGWRNTSPYFGDGVARVPCAALYHEMVHANDIANNTLDRDQACNDKMMSKAEARAMYWENRFRAEQKQFYGKPYAQRTKYGTNPMDVPKDMKECDKPPTLPWKPPSSPENSEECGANCGMTNGDPHLRTFDGTFFDFQAAGEFVAIESRTDAMRIQVRQQPFPGSDLVSVNTAVAMDVGGDRVGVYLDDGRLRTLVNGRTSTAETTTLRGGGTVSLWNRHGQGYAVAGWPDGSRARVRQVGLWGLALEVSLSEARRGTVGGLLGDNDGNPGNDLMTSDGRPATDSGLYGEFADSWRVRPETSLFDYAPGQSTRTFTDRGFPRAGLTARDIPNRAAAEAICRGRGLTMPKLVDACVIDLALTGQASFADSAASAQTVAVAAGLDGAPAPGTTTEGGTLRDGGSVTGAISAPGERDTYRLEIGAATVFRLVDVVGEGVRIDLAGPPGGDAPGFSFTNAYIYRVQPGAEYRLEVSGSGGGTGPYGFRLITSKERRQDAAVGDQISGRLDVPGRTDLYAIQAADAAKLYLAGGGPCADIAVAVVDDGPQPRAYSPSRACWEINLADLQPGRRYLIAVWSDTGRTGDYTFRIATR